MASEPDSDSVLVTARQRAVYEVLANAGFTEGSGVGDEATETSPVALAFILDGVLSSNPTEDELLDAMTWGHRELRDQLRPVARRLLELTKPGSSPA